MYVLIKSKKTGMYLSKQKSVYPQLPFQVWTPNKKDALCFHSERRLSLRMIARAMGMGDCVYVLSYNKPTPRG